ncbi:unnamed protein product, partial [Anisakis simplex]|uniref:Acyl-coenzyme A thioesterase 13 (inferred by orthology to a human protein) n=1 Tax=Anisakis simplex TaxID=6269 RepID=A0A0M3J7J3_ANISI
MSFDPRCTPETWLEPPFYPHGKQVLNKDSAYLSELLESYRIRTCRVLSVDEGHVKVEMEVTNEMLNPPGTMHGGCTATLVDIVTTTALMATERAKPGVSIDLTVSYMAAANPGDTIVIDG